MSGNATTSAPLTVNVQNAAPSGLVAAWAFDEGTGLVANDASGNAHAGTLSNATWAAGGKFGEALSFNGTDSWVTVDNAPDLMLTGGMTLEAWVRPSAIDGFETVVLKERFDPPVRTRCTHTTPTAARWGPAGTSTPTPAPTPARAAPRRCR